MKNKNFVVDRKRISLFPFADSNVEAEGELEFISVGWIVVNFPIKENANYPRNFIRKFVRQGFV